MTDPTTQSPVRQFTGWHMLAVVCSFFAVVIAANLTMALFATGSWTGLVVKNSYVASQQFNEQLMNARAQDELGWKSEIAYAAGQIRFTVHKKEGAGLSGAQVTAKLTRPVGIEQDHTITMIENRPGIYQHDGVLAPGVWNVEVLAQVKAGTDYRQIFRLHIPETD